MSAYFTHGQQVTHAAAILDGILKDDLLKYPAPAFSLCCNSIRFGNLPEDAIKSIIQDCNCLPAPLHCAGKSALAFTLHLIYY
jgi:hypothetical protein